MDLHHVGLYQGVLRKFLQKCSSNTTMSIPFGGNSFVLLSDYPYCIVYSLLPAKPLMHTSIVSLAGNTLTLPQLLKQYLYMHSMGYHLQIPDEFVTFGSLVQKQDKPAFYEHYSHKVYTSAICIQSNFIFTLF